ncbi:MAG: hypothetical protein WCS73_07960 [Lentisphaeria bacterium]
MNHSLLANKTFKFKDVLINFENQILHLGNDLFVRQIDLSEIVPRTKSFVYLPLNQELCFEQSLFDFSFLGYNFPKNQANVEFELVNIDVSVVKASWHDGEHVKIKIHMKENIQQLEFLKSYFVYPQKAFLGTQNSIRSQVHANIFWNRRNRLDRPEDFSPENQESRVDTLRLSSDFKAKKCVQFRGQTDTSNNLVIEHTDLPECVNGNLLFCESNDCGIFFLQEAPPSTERRDFEDHDFRITADNTICSCCWGIAPHEVETDRFLNSYRHTIVIYPIGEEQQSLKKYLRLRFPETEENYTVTVNPWGCGHFPEWVNENFLLNEIAASGEIHATHYQIDDGWQKGRSLQELISNNRNIQPDYWKISKVALPNGLDKLLKQSHSHDVKIALWVAPSFNCEYNDWQQFADILFDFYKKLDIRIFKIDAVKIRTKEAEENLEKLFFNLRERSNGEIFFNLDITNGQRSGYFMFLEYGNLFLENRYVSRASACPYHPESTLKNLWCLSKYVRSQILQIEVADPNLIDSAIYAKKQLSPPDIYPLEYWLAISMFANPLIWLAPSKLPDDSKKVFRQMIDLHLKYRAEIFREEIYPIGDEPNGKALTGFISTNSMGTKGFLLLFREALAPESTLLKISYIKQPVVFHKIAGKTGEIVDVSNNRFKIKIAQPASFLLLQFNSKSTS